MVKKKKKPRKKIKKKVKRASFKRKTRETSITAKLNVNGKGKYKIKTQIPFLTHMLEQLSKHSRIDIDMTAKGDVEVDAHHITEDVGIVIGEAIIKAIGDKRGIRRFGSAQGVLDEALCRVVVDISGRTFLDFNLQPGKKRIGNFDTELIEEFFSGLARGGKMTLHVDQIKGKNTHHIIEAAFKGLALALKEALTVEGKGLPSTKGKL